MADRVILLSIPQLRIRDVAPGALASLERLARRGSVTPLTPSFPDLSASSFATMITGVGPNHHGIIGNAYYDRAARRVVPAPLPDSALEAPRVWEQLRAIRPSARTLLWFAPNSAGASAEIAAWLDPSWTVRSQPEDLANDLVRRFGPYPKPQPSGEPPRLEASAWILKSAAEVIRVERPDLAIVRIPYLGQVARRFGPDGREAGRAVRELESFLGPFLASVSPDTLVLAATESIVTPVVGPVFPNVVLGELGLLATRREADGSLALDLDASAAFALTDHQLCHIYLNDRSQAATIAAAFAGDHSEGIARVASNAQRAKLGLDHPRAGDVILVATPDRWFAPNWWTNPKERPARDPTGLIRATPAGLLDAAHVRGSVAAPVEGPEDLGLLASSEPVTSDPMLSSRSVVGLVLNRLDHRKNTTGTSLT